MDLPGFARVVKAHNSGKKGRKLARPKILEKYVKQQVLQYLALKGVWAWNNPSGGAFIPHEGKKASEQVAYAAAQSGAFHVEQSRGKRSGHFVKFGKEGSPDVIGVLPGGKFLGVETKASKDDSTSKRRQELQDAFGAEILRRGGIYIKAKSVEDVVEALKPILGGW